MKHATRQQLTGIVVNQGNNIPRDAYDLLKATLFNCMRDGPASQNRDGHQARRETASRVHWPR